MGIGRKRVILGGLREKKKAVLIIYTLILEFGRRYFQNFMTTLRALVKGIAARKVQISVLLRN